MGSRSGTSRRVGKALPSAPAEHRHGWEAACGQTIAAPRSERRSIDGRWVRLSVRGATPITDFQSALRKARSELISILEPACGHSVDQCAKEDIGRLGNEEADGAFYDATQTYDLQVVYPKTATTKEDVKKLAPEAGYLLIIAFPSLALKQADKILTETEGPGDGFLDNGSSFGVYSRLNLYAAARRLVKAAEDHRKVDSQQ